MGEPAERRLSTDQIATLYNYATATIPPTPVGFIPDVSQSHFEIEHVHQRGHFDKLANLNHLSIRHNDITHIPHDTFWQAGQLGSFGSVQQPHCRNRCVHVQKFVEQTDKVAVLVSLQSSADCSNRPIKCRSFKIAVKDVHYAGLFLTDVQHGIGQGIQSGDW